MSWSWTAAGTLPFSGFTEGGFAIIRTVALLCLVAAPLMAAAMLLTPRSHAQAPPATSPASPAPSATPPLPARTPLPVPTGLFAALGPLVLMNPDGTFIQPAERDYRVTVSWNADPGFMGAYEVEGARGPRPGLPMNFTRIAVVPGGAAVEGKLSVVDEDVSFMDFLNLTFCFRVRSVLGVDAGPFTRTGCTLSPPHSDQPVIDATPRPPSVGSGPPPGADHSNGQRPLATVVALLAAVVVALECARPRRSVRVEGEGAWRDC